MVNILRVLVVSTVITLFASYAFFSLQAPICGLTAIPNDPLFLRGSAYCSHTEVATIEFVVLIWGTSTLTVALALYIVEWCLDIQVPQTPRPKQFTCPMERTLADRTHTKLHNSKVQIRVPAPAYPHTQKNGQKRRFNL
jgi:hypothetical protein